MSPCATLLMESVSSSYGSAVVFRHAHRKDQLQSIVFRKSQQFSQIVFGTAAVRRLLRRPLYQQRGPKLSAIRCIFAIATAQSSIQTSPFCSSPTTTMAQSAPASILAAPTLQSDISVSIFFSRTTMNSHGLDALLDAESSPACKINSSCSSETLFASIFSDTAASSHHLD